MSKSVFQRSADWLVGGLEVEDGGRGDSPGRLLGLGKKPLGEQRWLFSSAGDDGREGRVWPRSCFRLIRFEMPLRHPRGKVEKAVGYMSLGGRESPD